MLYNLFSARGKYIALLEGDDYWIDNSKLQKQYQFLENHQECVSVCQTTNSWNSMPRASKMKALCNEDVSNLFCSSCSNGLVMLSTFHL